MPRKGKRKSCICLQAFQVDGSFIATEFCQEQAKQYG
jgi:hypothetical protein